jgi:predicted amidohydrolase YtcJ
MTADTIYTGGKADVLKSKGAVTKLVDLGGKTLMPGFVDGHSHFGGVGIQNDSVSFVADANGIVGIAHGLMRFAPELPIFVPQR